jgi:hypothetical protein
MRFPKKPKKEWYFLFMVAVGIFYLVIKEPTSQNILIFYWALIIGGTFGLIASFIIKEKT